MWHNHRYTALNIDALVELDEPDEFHMLPDIDVMQHQENYRCPCQPKKFISIYNATEIWLHNKVMEQIN